MEERSLKETDNQSAAMTLLGPFGTHKTHLGIGFISDIQSYRIFYAFDFFSIDDQNLL